MSDDKRMNISDEAVEAAAAAFYNDPSGLTSWDRATRVSPEMAGRYRAAMARALEAAAPHLIARVLEDLALQAEDLDDDGLTSIWIRTRSVGSLK